MAAYGDIGRKAARAIAAVIKSNQPGTAKLSGVQVVAQFDATQLGDEYVAVVCTSCVGESIGDVFTGNWRCDIEVAYINDDSIRHTLVVVEGDTKVGSFELKVNKKGDVDLGTINLPAGQYVLFCTVPGHQNMKADLTVK